MNTTRLGGLGWSPAFARHLGADETAARVAVVHRGRVDALAPEPVSLLVPKTEDPIAVGDWITYDGPGVTGILPRTSQLERGAAGGVGRQLIAANVDTLAIVTSCNDDFNIARLERYLALAHGAGCLPLVVLTKPDLQDPSDMLTQAQRLGPQVVAIALDARHEAEKLAPWCTGGQTLALVGSSGVGKTTVLNGLTGRQDLTAGIREDDAKGRHTTTTRFLRPTHHGGWIIDTPGMRELRLVSAADAVSEVFRDIEDLAAECRFSDCAHETEPGCAVRAALTNGTLDPARLERWRKLTREAAHQSETRHEARARHKAFGKMGRAAAKHKRSRYE